MFSVSPSGVLNQVAGSPLALPGGSGPAFAAFSPGNSLLASANAASSNISVFNVTDCTPQFNQGFNSGFNAGFNPGWRSEFSKAYKRGGAWQIGWQRGFITGRRHKKPVHGVREATIVAAPAAATQPRSAAVPTLSACDVVFNGAFNRAFNIGFNSGYNSAFNFAFNQGYRSGLAKGRAR